ncbi:MAG: arginine decarboxylase, pyruvoyl-dependent, partial [Nitrosopumilales archaeon]|nr:arginine decarboxylase, pyruvoyl-dependent [Nitrosopumilales archaeon]
MLDLVPKKLFLTRGKGVHKDRLTSFEYALRDAGIAGTNLVLISSIFPPEAKLVSKTEGLKLIDPGQILFTIYSRNQTNEPHRLTAASVGIAQPKDTTHYGYLSEYDSFGQTEKEAGDYAEDIAAQMLASSLGIKFDLD